MDNQKITSLKDLQIQIKKTVLSDGSFCLKKYTDIVERYDSDDWKQYVKFSDSGYRRNTVPECSDDLFEFVIICWNNNQRSQIHDHPDNGCILKVLQGDLSEDVYQKSDNKATYQYIGTNRVENGTVSYMEKTQIIHRIRNSDKQTVSLHIYSPPDYICKPYDMTE